MSLSCDALEFWTAKFDHPGENSDDRFCFSLPIVEIRRPEFRPDRHLPPTCAAAADDIAGLLLSLRADNKELIS